MTNYATQQQNDDMMSLIASQFRLLYNPTHAFADAMSMYQSLPGLVGYWPGAIGTNALPNNLVDYSQSGLHMTRAGSTVENENSAGLNRYLTLDGSTGYHYITDSPFTSFGLAGAMGATQGFTITAWVRPTSGTGGAVSSKLDTSTANRAFALLRTAGNLMQFTVSGNGSSLISVFSTNVFANNEWRFVAARWTPSTQLKVWEGYTYGLVSSENTTSIPAALFDSTADLAIGAINTVSTPSNFWFGDISLLAICRKAIPEQFINIIYQMTAPLFNVSI